MKEWLQRMAEELVDDTIYEATMLGLLEAREEAERDDIVEEVGAKRLDSWNQEAQGLGFRVQGSGIRVQGSGFRVQGSGFRVQVQGSGIRVQVQGFRV